METEELLNLFLLDLSACISSWQNWSLCLNSWLKHVSSDSETGVIEFAASLLIAIMYIIISFRIKTFPQSVNL